MSSESRDGIFCIGSNLTQINAYSLRVFLILTVIHLPLVAFLRL